MGRILDVFLLVGRFTERILAAIRTNNRQADREMLHNCPSDWFNDHFSGMRDNDADQATKADIENRE